MWQDLSLSYRRRQLRRGIRIAALGASALLCLAVAQWNTPTPRLIYNASASAPLGFYRLHPINTVRRGELVLMTTPGHVRELADQRRYLPKTVPMIKTVAAISGDEICALGSTLTLNGVLWVTRQSHDSAGRSLPMWHGCRVLKPDEFLPLNVDAPLSFDGRYFGPVSVTLVRGRLEKL